MKEIPSFFLERLRQIIPEPLIPSAFETFTKQKTLSVRLNTLKQKREHILCLLKERGIPFSEVPWYQDALILSNLTKEEVNTLDFIKQGLLYRQSLSSMLVPLILGPCPGERILDLCSAPGSKTAQIAAMMDNQGEIICVEAVRERFYKLKSVISLLGVQNTKLKLLDGRRFKDFELFDKILVDAPCSCEGLFHASLPKTFAYWSPRKIREMARKQKGLLFNAARLLRKGGTLVYSTCTFSPEENEEVIDWLLRKSKVKLNLISVGIKDLTSYPCLLSWRDKEMNNEIRKCLRILPTALMDGFFIAKIRKEE